MADTIDWVDEVFGLELMGITLRWDEYDQNIVTGGAPPLMAHDFAVFLTTMYMNRS